MSSPSIQSWIFHLLGVSVATETQIIAYIYPLMYIQIHPEYNQLATSWVKSHIAQKHKADNTQLIAPCWDSVCFDKLDDLQILTGLSERVRELQAVQVAP